jgi:hypothetical protein
VTDGIYSSVQGGLLSELDLDGGPALGGDALELKVFGLNPKLEYTCLFSFEVRQPFCIVDCFSSS